MNWAETMKHNATVAVGTRVADDESVLRRTQTASWDPFEVWLTRIKQPRDSTSISAAVGRSTGAADPRD